MKTQFPSDFEQFINSLDNQPAISLRLNPDKTVINSDSFEKVAWCTNGIFLKARPSFTLDPLFHSGVYYVQEASSMFIEQAIKQIELPENCVALDLCAAPGGKSTHLLSLLDDTALLVSNEVIRTRVSVLNENISKWGHNNVIITNNDPSHFTELEGLFDLVLVDAPCSGEGLFRRDESAISQWSADNARMCSVRQQRILSDIWPAIKTGAYLIYSTCTFNPDENEENLKWIIENNEIESIQISIKPEWGVDEIQIGKNFAYRFLPHKVKGEGFFITVLRKKDGNYQTINFRKTKSNFERIPKQFSNVRNWLTSNNTEYLIKHENIIAFPENKIQVLNYISGKLRLISFGATIAQYKKTDLLPEHYLALSIDRNPAIFESVELNLQDALLFQKKDEIRIDLSTKGWITVQYQGIPLGFIKNLGTRANNYFPKEWRIRMNLPELTQPWYLL